MKKLSSLLLVSVIAAPAYAGDLDTALSKIPSVGELCGAVPTAPARVRQPEGHKLLTRAGKKFAFAADEWLACATETSAKTQLILADMQDGAAKDAVIDHLNTDYAEQYAGLNTQLERFEDRANVSHGQWSQANLVLPNGHVSCHGTKDQQRLCFSRNATYLTEYRTRVQEKLTQPVSIKRQTPPTFGR
jgi:hypothetical protein